MTREEITERIRELELREQEVSSKEPAFNLETSEGWDEHSKWFRLNMMSLIREIEQLEDQIRALDNLEVKVGDGITICCWSDRLAFTVISRTAKTITIQRDRAIRTDDNGMSDCQQWKYERSERCYS